MRHPSFFAAATCALLVLSVQPAAAQVPGKYKKNITKGLEWLARTYRLALSYGEPTILSAAELDEVTAESRRRRYGERRAAREPGRQ